VRGDGLATKSPRKAGRNPFHPTLRKADWSAWVGITNEELWKIVALSCDIEPYCLRGWLEHRPFPARKRVAMFQKRLWQAVADLDANDGALRAMSKPARQTHSRVHLGTFRAWATKNEWELPPEFPNIVAHRVLSEDPRERESEVVLLVQEQLMKPGMSEKRAFENVAPRVPAVSGEGKGKPVHWETVKKIYKRAIGRGTTTPATPTTPNPRRRS
jgi:hypothetical protein